MLIDNIYVINLDRSENRLKKITDNFNNYNLSFKRFSATDGKKLCNDDINKKASSLCKYFVCNYGIIGCADSHKKLWKQLSEDSNTDYYVILEDDAVIDNKFINVIKNVEPKLKENNVDILSLHCKVGYCNISKTVFNIDEFKFGKTLFPVTATCYIISKDCAKKLLLKMEKINWHIDVELAIHNLFNNINYFVSNPSVVSTNFEESTIGHINTYSILLTLLDKLGYKYIPWISSVPVLTINLKYVISVYMLFIIFLFILNSKIWKNKYINIILLIEFILINLTYIKI